MSLYTLTFESEAEGGNSRDNNGEGKVKETGERRKIVKRRRISKKEHEIEEVPERVPTPPATPSPPNLPKKRKKSKSQKPELPTEEAQNFEEIKQGKFETPKKPSFEEEEEYFYEEEISEKHETQTFWIERAKTMSIRGSRTHFQLLQGGFPLFHSKIKTNSSTEVIPISEGTETHFSASNYAGYLRSDSNYSNFSLRIGSDRGEEKMVIRYFSESKIEKPRSAKCFITISDKLKMKLSSQEPTLSEYGEWEYDMQIPTIVKSIKNMVLEDEKKKTVLTIGKVTKSALQIEADERIPPLTVFAIGISAFLCKL